MAYEDTNMDLGPEEPDEGVPPPEDSGNRTFFIVAGIIGGIMLLALICLALYALVLAPRQRSQQAAQVATVNAQNTQVAMAAEKTALAGKWTATPTVTPVMPTATTTPTPVVAPTQAGSPTVDRTATVAALLTEAAAGKLTATSTASGLPDTGFAEDVGLPILVGLAFVLIVIIFLARRLRATS
jgi:LPXTG-motif cell wall-anchored protein